MHSDTKLTAKDAAGAKTLGDLSPMEDILD